MTSNEQYVIRGGVEGRERLRVLARVMHPGTASLLDRLEVGEGMVCLDAGCGGGDVTRELARRVAPGGRVVGVDIDETTLDVGRREAEAEGMRNIEFRALDIRTQQYGSGFDFVYARFLLTHLRDPGSTVTTLSECLRPGGVLAVEDIDFSGAFTWPESAAFRRYTELYCGVVHKRGGDPNIGKRLPLLLVDAGLQDVELNVVQPMGIKGDMKLLDPITLASIAEAVAREGLASLDEIEAIVRELYRFAGDPRTVAGLPRIVQAWGRRPPV